MRHYYFRASNNVTLNSRCEVHNETLHIGKNVYKNIYKLTEILLTAEEAHYSHFFFVVCCWRLFGGGMVLAVVELSWQWLIDFFTIHYTQLMTSLHCRLHGTRGERWKLFYFTYNFFFADNEHLINFSITKIYCWTSPAVARWSPKMKSSNSQTFT